MGVRGGHNLLSQVPLFSGLTARHLRRLASEAQEALYMEGASVVKEGDEADAFFVILEGEARVVRPRGRTVTRLRPGDSFGEISLLDGGRRTATVVSETPLTVMMLSRKAFTKMVRDEPDVAINMLGQLARMLRRMERPISG